LTCETTRSPSRESRLPPRQGGGDFVFILSLRSPRSKLGQRENGAKRDTRFTGAASAAGSSGETFYLSYTSKKGWRPVNIGPRRSYFRSRVASLKGVGMKEAEGERWRKATVSLLHGGFYDFGVNLHVRRKLAGVQTSPEESVYSRIKREQMQRGGAATARKTFTRWSLYLFRSSCASRLPLAIGVVLVAALQRCSIIKAILPLSIEIRGIKDSKGSKWQLFPANPAKIGQCSRQIRDTRTLRTLHGRAIDSMNPPR